MKTSPRSNSSKTKHSIFVACVAAVLGFIIATGPAAFAAWLATGNDATGSTRSVAISAGATPTLTVLGPTSASLTFARALVGASVNVESYKISRYNRPTAAAPSANFVCAWPTGTPLVCNDTAVPTGSWYYTVTPLLTASTWIGTESAKSTPLNTDVTAPTVLSISRSGATPTNAGTVAWTLTFSEAVNGVDVTDFSLVRTGLSDPASAISLGGSGATYTVTVNTGTSDGTLGLNLVDNNTIVDQANNALASSSGANGSVTGPVYSIDTILPTVTINRAASQPALTKNAPINFTVVFSEAVNGFAGTDVTLSGTAGPTTASVTGSGTTYNVAVGSMSSNGTVLASIGAGRAQDTAGNASAASTSSDNVVIYDTIAPVAPSKPLLAVAQDSGASASDLITNVRQLTFSGTAELGSTVTLFDGGTNVGSAVATDGTYVATTSTLSSGGRSITARATDGAGNTGSSSAASIVTIDITAPSVTVTRDLSQAPVARSVPIKFTVTFSESVTGVNTTDLVRSGTSMGGAIAVDGNGAVYTITVTGGVTDGTMAFSLAAGAGVDVAGNASDASTGTSTVTIDSSSPTVTINRKSNQQEFAHSTPIYFTVAFSESVTGFTTADLSRTGTSSGGTVALSGSGANYEIAVSGSLSEGTIAFALPAMRVFDLAGNGNAASSSTASSVTYDVTRPRLLSKTTTSGTVAGLMQQGDTLTLNFSEALDASTVPSSVTVTERRNGSSSLSIPGIIDPASIANSYLGSNNTDAIATATVSLSTDKKTITITLGTVSGSPAIGSGSVSIDPNSALQDIAGNAASPTSSASVSRLF